MFFQDALRVEGKKTQALLSSETEPQDNQPVCNPSKECQLDGQPPQDIVSLPVE